MTPRPPQAAATEPRHVADGRDTTARLPRPAGLPADDPRHGTEAGCREHYRRGGKPCDPCREAHRRRNIMRQLYPAKRPALGSRRRLQALQAIGYGRDRLAAELGYTDGGAITRLMRPTTRTVLTGTAERIADVYDRLCMTIPQGAGPTRARTWAKRHGYPPPLAWDDIDDPDEQPRGMAAVVITEAIDPTVVEHLLAGRRIESNPAEKCEAMRRWLALGRSEKSLCDLHGWRGSRYKPRKAA